MSSSPFVPGSQIAREVIERPASGQGSSNALDAGVESASQWAEREELIGVEDDGVGMEPEDARLAIERHATSKIASQDDLAAIRTLISGRSAPSIASVSRFQLMLRGTGEVV
jgi:DNA mismatch repair protein MutL